MHENVFPGGMPVEGKRSNYIALAAALAALESARAGLTLCAQMIVPSLLPFFMLSSLLQQLGLPGILGRLLSPVTRKLFGIGGAGASALLLGVTGGYPLGADAVARLRRSGALTREQAERALAFCNNSGPGFFAGLIGTAVLGDVRRGLILYGLHALAALMTGLLLPGSAPPAALRTVRREKPVLSSLLPEAVQGSCAALLQVSGLIVFFSSMLAVLRAAGLTALLPNRLAEALACGALELSSGILLLSGHGAEAACALLMGWGGLCVHFQAMSLWQTAGLRPHGYFSAKLLHGLLSAALALACFAPSPAALLSAGALTACALLAPLLRKIRAGNLRHVAV